jgi:tripartite-type tricarboxylate transporter receptor subunit TctC
MSRQAGWLAVVAVWAWWVTPAIADVPFYQGKTIRIVVGYPTGGGYDNAARLLARHIGKHIPGQPAVIVQNMEGAGSLRAANYVYGVGPQDGTVIASVNQSLPLLEMAGGKGIRFTSTKLKWLGSMQSSNSVLVTWKASGIRSLDIAKRIEAPLGTGGQTADSYIHVVAINRLLGTKFKIVAGYQGTQDISLAMERGEVAGRAGLTWATVIATQPNWIAEKKIDVLLQMGDKPEPDLPTVPLLQDLVTSQDDKQIVTLLTLPIILGFAHWVGPEVPDDRLAILRRAYDETMQDSEFLAEAAKSAMLIRSKKSDAIEALVKQAASTPGGVLAQFKAMLGWTD